MFEVHGNEHQTAELRLIDGTYLLFNIIWVLQYSHIQEFPWCLIKFFNLTRISDVISFHKLSVHKEFRGNAMSSSDTY